MLALSLVGVAVVSIAGMAASELTQRSATRDLRDAYSSLAQIGAIQKQLLTSHLAHSSERNRPGHTPFGVGTAFVDEQLQHSMDEARQHLDDQQESELFALLEFQVREDGALLEQMKNSSVGGAQDQAALDDAIQLDASLEGAMETSDRLIELHRQELVITGQRLASRTRAVSWLRTANAVLLLILAAIFLALARRFVNGIEGLRQAIDDVRTGDLQSRAPPARFSELQDVSNQFNRMTEQFERARNERAMFLSAVAHDLRTPLFALRSATQLLERSPSLEGCRRRSAVIQRQVDRLDRMVEDLLDASRVEAGNVELRRQKGDLREVVRECLQLFEDSSQKHDLTSDLPSAPVWADFDETRMAQVLVNLLSNAIKYSPDGGEVHVALERGRDRWLRLSVEDEGIGMTDEDRERVFVPFRRVSRDDRIPGVGLGLAVVRRLVEAHGGRVVVESQTGVGSTFTVMLPEARPSAALEEDASATT